MWRRGEGDVTPDKYSDDIKNNTKLVEKPNDPKPIDVSSRILSGSSIKIPAITVATVTKMDIGKIRRARRAQNCIRLTPPSAFASLSNSDVMRKPEITKKTSTPIYPPCSHGTPAWFSTTNPTATARNPSISFLRTFTFATLLIASES